MIEVHELVKEYRVSERAPGMKAALKALFRRPTKAVRAVDGLSLQIAEGERVGFLGPNGAGKTTTLKMLSGLLHPTSGSCRVLGSEPKRRERQFLRQITLVMGQKQQLLWDLPPAETFLLNKAVYDIGEKEYAETLAELTALLDLGGLLNKPTRNLSLGERMKCELAVALLHRPKVLFLDEPTIGLDVSMQASVRGFIRAYNERFGATVLLTSHYMEDVAALCPRVIVIDHGRLLFDGQLEALVKEVRPEKRLRLRLSRAVTKADLAGLGAVVEEDGAQATLLVPQARLQEAVSQAMARLPLVDLSVEDPPLEEVMQDLFARNRPAAQDAGAPGGKDGEEAGKQAAAIERAAT
jgi:ABC-2 type transport system ATP-binding protein